MAGSVPDPAEANSHAWELILDRLERDVQVVEELARAGGDLVAPAPAPWEPPEINGPIPDHLLHRAREIHRRQSEARLVLSGALATNRASSRQLVPRSAASAGPAPAYVDVSA